MTGALDRCVAGAKTRLLREEGRGAVKERGAGRARALNSMPRILSWPGISVELRVQKLKVRFC